MDNEKPKDGESQKTLEEIAKENILDNKPENDINGATVTKDDDGMIESLGTVRSQDEILKSKLQDEGKVLMNKGYKNIPLKTFPSEGCYYPANYSVMVRPAREDEIKHYSSMDEEDFLDRDEKIGAILNACLLINNGAGSYQDLKEFDKIFALFTIRDITMTAMHRDVKLWQEAECGNCPNKMRKEITNDIFGYYSIPQSIMKYYDVSERCFIIKHPDIGVLKVYVPSIGMMKYIANYMKDKEIEKARGRNVYYDKQFLTFLQYIVPDWSMLNEEFMAQQYREFTRWSLDKHELMLKISDKINVGIKPTVEMKCDKCGQVSHPILTFRNGYRSIFHFSSLAGELIED